MSDRATFRDVVVPLDGSSFSESAIAVAGWVATESGARLHLVRAHVPNDDDSVEQPARTAVAHYLNEMAAWLAEGGTKDVRVETLDGSPALAIADYVDRVDADLIVMTTHGRTGAERRRLGSVSSVVAHHARCPVLLTRGVAGEYVPKRVTLDNIIIAVDGTEPPEDVAGLALKFATLDHPAFRIMHTLSPALALEPAIAGDGVDDGELERRAKEQGEIYVCDIARRLRQAGLRAEVLVTVADEPAKAIFEAAERYNAGGVVLVR